MYHATRRAEMTNVNAKGATFACARTAPMKRCALLAPLDHTPPTLPAQVRSVVVTTTTTPLSLSAPATFQCGHGTFNFKDSPSTLHPSRRSPSNQFAASATRAASAQAGRRPRLTYRQVVPVQVVPVQVVPVQVVSS